MRKKPDVSQVPGVVVEIYPSRRGHRGELLFEPIAETHNGLEGLVHVGSELGLSSRHARVEMPVPADDPSRLWVANRLTLAHAIVLFEMADGEPRELGGGLGELDLRFGDNFAHATEPVSKRRDVRNGNVLIGYSPHAVDIAQRVARARAHDPQLEVFARESGDHEQIVDFLRALPARNVDGRETGLEFGYRLGSGGVLELAMDRDERVVVGHLRLEHAGQKESQKRAS